MRTYREQVEKDIEDGLSAGVTGTPTFFINKRMVTGNLTTEAFMGIAARFNPLYPVPSSKRRKPMETPW